MISGEPEMETPRTVSVLMSVYNGERYLRAAINSILSQSFGDFEFIIIDDGSEDGTWRVLTSYADPRIRLVRNEQNLGLTRSLNKGLALARGRYIARQDADDISMPQRFERQLSVFMRNPNAAAVFTAFNYIDENGEVKGTVYPPTDSQLIRESLFHVNPLCHGSAMMRREAVDSVGGYDISYATAQDRDLWLRLSDCFALEAIPEVLYQLRVYATSVSGRRRREQWRNAVRAAMSAFSRCGGVGLSARAVALHHFYVGLYYFSEGLVQEGAHRLHLALEADKTLEQASEQLLNMAVSLALELGPSGRTLVRTRSDMNAASDFLHILAANLPKEWSTLFCRDLFAEFYAACAYLYHMRKRPWETTYCVVQSWLSGPRHHRNRGLVRMIVESLR